MMLKTEPIRLFIKLCIASSYIKKEDSISGIIIANPESGKTRSLMEYTKIDGIRFLSDVTYTGLINMLQDIESGRIKTLLIPDMLKVYGRKVAVSKNFFTTLNELIEEGIKEIEIMDNRMSFKDYVRCNVVGAVTYTEMLEQATSWGQTGFFSRVIPFSYSYDVDDIKEILLHIMEEKHFNTMFQKIREQGNKLPVKDIKLGLDNAKRINIEIVEPLRKEFEALTHLDIYGFRFQRNMQVMAKAHAYCRGSDKVEEKDVDALVKLSKWFDFNRRPL